MAAYTHVRLKPEDAKELDNLATHVGSITGNNNPSKPDIIRFLINSFKKTNKIGSK